MTPSPLATWHDVVAARDLVGLRALLAKDCVFYSPVVHAPQIGQALTYHYLSAAFQVFFNSSFRYVREVSNQTDAILEFEVVIDGIAVNGVDMIKWNSEQQITEFKVMIRPLKAINLIHQAMGAMLNANTR